VSELPDSWAEAGFTALFDVQGGTQPPKSTFVYEPTQGYVQLLQIRDFGEKPMPTFIPDARGLKKCESEDILIARYGASLGRILTGLTGAYNVAMAKVIIPDEFDRKFVYYLLKSEAFQAPLRLVSRSAQNGFNKDDLAAFRMPIAPLAEQKRIADKLEAVLGRVDACRSRLDRVPDLLKRFRQSVLAAATSGKLTEDWREKNECLEDAAALLERMAIERRAVHAAQDGSRKYREADPVADEQLPEIPVTWRWTNFDHCSSEISVGHVGPMKDRYVDEGTAFLRCQNVRPLRFDPRGLVRIPPSFHSQLGKSKLCGGEILVVRSGANTGDCCVFPRTFGEANCSDLVITRPLSGLCSEYGALYVNSPTGQSLLDQKQAGVAQPHFNIGAMRVKAFPLAPLAEQTEIVRRVEALFALADRIEARLATAQRLVERLTPATLSKAFRGDLVPQDPNDEPASVLLERLSGNAGSGVKPKAKGRPSSKAQ
jgi:type I restriction enzyme S subunit